MKSHSALRILALACCLTACSSSSSGGGGGVAQKQNRDPDSAYGFDGAGWSQSENVDGQDIWIGPSGLALVIEIDDDVGYASAQEWAEDEYGSTATTGASMAFEAESLGNGTWWWGWYYGGDVFEGYLLNGSRGVAPELQANEDPLSKSDASAIMKTFVLGQ